MKKMNEKHPLDKSQSRKIILKNGLKVFLLSDPTFNVSSASMSVAVGSLDNPEDRQGLAHFLEHMLFLGTEKYPDVDDYKTHLRNYGGGSNAYTAGDKTNYHFQLFPEGFEGALDRFAQFFISPLFTKKYTDREINAVNSEYQKNIMNDGRRTYRIMDTFSKKGHPQRMFSTGNLETLNNVTREELISFYDKQYSADRMSLSLLSNHSLDILELWAKENFSGIKNKKIGLPYYDPDFLEQKKTFRLVSIEPVKDLRSLDIMFPLPGNRKYYKNKPGRQFGFIVGHEGPGSLLSYLKASGWATSLSAYAGSSTGQYGEANISIELTKKGLKDYKEVVKSVYSYIKMIKKEGFQSHVFNELKSMASLEEIFSNKGEGTSRAIGLANELNMYNFEDAGRVSYIYEDNSPAPYKNLLSHIRLDNMIVTIVAKGVKTDKIEKHYNAKYSYTEDIKLYNELMNVEILPDFNIPNKNIFIPKNVAIPKRELISGIKPELLIDEKGAKLYFGQDHEFLRPKGVISYKILLPKSGMNLENRVLSRFYVACVNESINELSYPARQAGLYFSFYNTYEGFYLIVSGYKESSLKLYESILTHMVNIDISNEKFEAIKDKIIRVYENTPLADAHRQTRENAANIFNHIKYDWEESLSVAGTITLTDIKSYEKSVLSKTYVEALVYGDHEKESAKNTFELFKQISGTTPLSPEDVFRIKYLQQDKQEDIQLVGTLEVNNSCFYREYEIGNDNPEYRAATMILGQACSQPFFTEMRTNQQLGYIVWSYTRSREKTNYLNFLIQSGGYNAAELNQRSNDFISTLPKYIEELDSDIFSKLKLSAIEKIEKTPKSIQERANKLSDLIFEKDADFSRDNKTIMALNKINQNRVYEILSNTLDKKSRKMTNFLMFSKDHKNNKKVRSSITDISSWKKGREYK
tara:strand:+ start:1224 stop:3989 length:2766 start_codon:yes stop_codon:yes gene_type:complete